MSKSRNPEYHRRKNRKKSWQRRQARRSAVEATMVSPEAAYLIQAGALSYEQIADLCPGSGARLQAIRKAARQYFYTNPFGLPSPSEPNRHALHAKHSYEPVQRRARPTDQSRLLADIMITNLAPLFYTNHHTKFNGSVASYHRCPRCSRGDALRIFPAPAAGDFYLRCHGCGDSFLTLEFLKAVAPRLTRTWEDTARRALELGVIEKPVAPEELAVLKRLEHWRNALEYGRAYHGRLVADGRIEPRFGDWAVFDRGPLMRLLAGIKYSPHRMLEQNLVHVLRNVFGFPSVITVYTLGYLPWAELRFSSERFLFSAPRWTDFTDWTSNLLIGGDHEVATALERTVCQWAPAGRVGVAMVAEAKESIANYAKPFQNVWVPLAYGPPAESGLPFVHAAERVKVPRLHRQDLLGLALKRSDVCRADSNECLVAVARDLAHDSRSLPVLISEILVNPAIAKPTGEKLVEAAAAMREESVEATVAALDVQSSPYAVRIGTGTYLCRGDVYHKKAKNGTFSQVSNFCVRIAGSSPYRRGNPSLDLRLIVGGHVTFLTITEAVFDNSVRLWKSLREAAREAGLDTPQIFTVPERRLLPEIIRATRQPQSLKKPQRSQAA